MTISLPDVNVLLALVAAGHTHHASALKWFDEQREDSVGICRVTHMGLLRLLTNPKVLSTGVCSIPRAWEISNEMFADRRVFFAHEPPGLDAAWAALSQHPAAGPSSWTDAYLAALAQARGYGMVTFDRGFQRWSEMALTVLVQMHD